jgi:hypothetical protein
MVDGRQQKVDGKFTLILKFYYEACVSSLRHALGSPG